MMRNPERMRKVLRELEVLWSHHPDWRLGQLIFNIAGRDPFYIEDYDLIKQGFEKFGKTSAIMTDFPEYYIEPNAWKKTINSLPETVKEEETR